VITMKKYNLVPGLIISVFIPLIVVIPVAIRLDSRSDIYVILQNLVFTFLLTLSCWIVNQYALNHFAMGSDWLKGTIALIICTFIAVLIQYPIKDSSESLPLMFNYNGLSEERKFILVAFRGFLLGGLEYFIAYYLKLSADNQKAKIENQMLKHENLEARLSLLKQQVSPHFLFNSLSTLRTIATDAPTRKFVMQLSTVYRYLLSNDDSHLATLESELEFTSSYLYILQERFEEGLQVDIQIPDQYLNQQIPPFSLQILVENAVKHNVVSQEDPLHIRVYIESNMLCVENNLLAKQSSEESTGKGLKNIRERFKLLSNKDIEIFCDHDKFLVKLPI